MSGKWAVAVLAFSLAGILRAAPPSTGPISAGLIPAPRKLAPNVYRPTTIDNNQSCDIGTYPAATLLLPYFEVDVTKPSNQATNTIFTVVNTAKVPQMIRVTIWTDYGYPAAWFNVFLTGFDAESFSLYDILASGKTPQTSPKSAVGARSLDLSANPLLAGAELCESMGGELPASMVADLQSMLTKGMSSAVNSCRIGNEHAMAVGYVTVDVVNGCSNVSPLDSAYYSQVLLFENVLTGDYERINPDPAVGNYAGGNPLVHIKAIPEGGKAGTLAVGTGLPYTFYDRFTPSAARRIDRRQPLPSVFAARFIEGGTGSFETDYAIWREGADRVTSACTASASALMGYASIVRFDEMENPTVAATPKPGMRPLAFPATSAASTAVAPFPPQVSFAVGGWMYLNLDNWAGATASALNPYSTVRPSQNWIVVHMRADGRYAVDYDATTLSNGCTFTATEYK
jgi:hypothetical protein